MNINAHNILYNDLCITKKNNTVENEQSIRASNEEKKKYT